MDLIFTPRALPNNRMVIDKIRDRDMKHTKEPADVQVVEKGIENGSKSAESVQLEVDPKALLRRMDLRFIPWLSFLYLLSFLDRSSIGNAKVCALYICCVHMRNSAERFSVVRSGSRHSYHGSSILDCIDSVLY